MSHKTAKKLRRLAREAGPPTQEGGETHITQWKEVTIKRKGKEVAKTERPIVKVNPLSLRGMVRALKKATR